MEAGGPKVQGLSWLSLKFKTSLGYLSSVLEKSVFLSCEWWSTPVISALRRLREDDRQESEDSLDTE